LSATSPNNTIVMQMPTGVTVPTPPTMTPTQFTLSSNTGTLDTSSSKVTWTIATKSTTTAGVGTISGLLLKAASSVAAGDIIATFTSGSALSQTLAIATAANRGLKSTVVAGSTTTFSTSPTALTTLPKTPANRVNVTAAGINLAENFADDIGRKSDGTATNDTLTVTLPSGVTYAADPGSPNYSNVTEVSSPDPTGFNTFTLTMSAGTPTKGGLLIGQSSALKVSVDSTVATGTVMATISGTIGGTAFTPFDVGILEVVSSGVTVAPNDTIPTLGIGASGTFGAFTLTETNAGALLANGSTITATLPTGASWSTSSKPTVAVTSGDLSLTSLPATLSSSNMVATWQVDAKSTTASVLTISGQMSLASTISAGEVEATIGGTAGAAGTVSVCVAADAVTATSSGIPTLMTATPTQAIGDLILTEAYAGGLGSGQFRLVSSAGSWSEAAPSISQSPTNAGKSTSVTSAPFSGTTISPNTNWDFDRATTFKTNDTMVVRTPSGASTIAAALTLSSFKLDIPTGVANGPVTVTLYDGGIGGTDGTGIKGTSLVMGYIGTIPTLAVSPTSVSVAEGSTTTATISGGLASYSATSDTTSVATVSVSGSTVTVTGVAAGTAVITITDSASPANTVTLDVTVTAGVPTVDIGTAAGVNSVTAAADDQLNLILNITNTQTTDYTLLTEEWLWFSGTIGGTNIGIWVWPTSGALTNVDDLLSDIAGNIGQFSLLTYDFDHSADTVTLISGTTLSSLLGMSSGDSLVYGYAYSLSNILGIVLQNYNVITIP
jgi:uncharacterized membrane protein